MGVSYGYTHDTQTIFDGYNTYRHSGVACWKIYLLQESCLQLPPVVSLQADLHRIIDRF